MQIVRTIVWIVITAILVAFIAMNWDHAPVNFWPTGDGYLHLEWPVGLIALVFFLLGLLPMWLLHRAGRWRLTAGAFTAASVEPTDDPADLALDVRVELETEGGDEARGPHHPQRVVAEGLHGVEGVVARCARVGVRGHGRS